MLRTFLYFFFFFFNDTATTEIYTLSLHDALPISSVLTVHNGGFQGVYPYEVMKDIHLPDDLWSRSEEHTSELQSQSNLVCRLLLEKKKNISLVPANSPSAHEAP